MSKSPWGNIGAWAAESEREEQEERELAAKAAAEAATGAGGGDSQSFPSLKDSVSSASKQTKKKTKMSLQEFTMQNSYGTGSASSRRGLTHEEMLRLPTGPKERSAGDEMQYGSGRLGGGFSDYGVRSGGGPPPGRMRDRDSDSEGSWGGGPRRSYGGFEDDRRRGPPQGRSPDFDQPSRADEVDNWATMKKSLPSFNSGPVGPGRPGRHAALGGGSGGFSRADEVDNWASAKKPIPRPDSRSSSFGSGFREYRPEPEKWTRDGNQERQRLVLEPPKGVEEGGEVVKVNKPNPFGAARPREEVLAEKGLDWKKLDLEIEAKKAVSRPASSQSSRPGSSQSAKSEGQALQGIGDGAVKPRPKVNPFGDAKPREVLLEEKGLDWRKIDLEFEHRRVERPLTEEEKNLKEEIEHLKKESLQNSGKDQSTLHDQILQKERDLELLIHELDDKVRFGQKPSERPGSGAGRFTRLPERPYSQPAAYEDSRSGEFIDRPRSRGTGDAWPRHMDDRRAFHGGRSTGFLGSRDMDRSSSRERW
ncbi:hypothetical protein ACH5RR_035565 [Cinchona calisaya]|uniref:Eukaryotic translation initiation factor 4B2 n=1 Tax=Cinchona calisaya TaxID=153742 RepID=A0ABD2Y2Z6_9GENT